MNYPNDNSTTPSPLVGRIYNGLDTRIAWPIITTPYTKPTGTRVVKKSWWRRLFGGR